MHKLLHVKHGLPARTVSACCTDCFYAKWSCMAVCRHTHGGFAKCRVRGGEQPCACASAVLALVGEGRLFSMAARWLGALPSCPIACAHRADAGCMCGLLPNLPMCCSPQAEAGTIAADARRRPCKLVWIFAVAQGCSAAFLKCSSCGGAQASRLWQRVNITGNTGTAKVIMWQLCSTRLQCTYPDRPSPCAGMCP